MELLYGAGSSSHGLALLLPLISDNILRVVAQAPAASAAAAAAAAGDTNSQVGCGGRQCKGSRPAVLISSSSSPGYALTPDQQTLTTLTSREVYNTTHTGQERREEPTSAPPQYQYNPLEELITMTAADFDTIQAMERVPQMGQAVVHDTGVAGVLNATTTAVTTTTSSSFQPNESEQLMYKTVPFEQVVFVLIASSIIAATIFGNVLVIIAVFSESKLRKVGNFFIVSLAISDLLVGLFVTPVALVYNLLGTWSFGEVFCNIWIGMDVICCTASIVNLCVISFDRYNAITQPLRYALRRTASRAIFVIALVWTYSVFIAVPPFLGWTDSSDHSATLQDGQCVISENVGYTIFSTVGAYYLPLVIMIVMYLKVFRATLKRKRNWIPLVRRDSYEASTAVTGNKRKSSSSSIRRARVLINVADSTERDDHYITDDQVSRHTPHRRRAPKMSLLMTSLSLQSTTGPNTKLGVTIQVPRQSSQESLCTTTTPSPEYRAAEQLLLRYPCSTTGSVDGETTVSERDAPSSSVAPSANHRKLLMLASSTESAGDVSDESGYEPSPPQISPAGGSLFARRMSPSPRGGATNSVYLKGISRSSSEKRYLFQKRLNPSFTTSTETTTTPTTGSEETLAGDTAGSAASSATTTADGRVRFSFSRRSCKFQFRVESEIQEEELSRGDQQDKNSACVVTSEQRDMQRKLDDANSARLETMSIDTVQTDATGPICGATGATHNPDCSASGAVTAQKRDSDPPMTPTTAATLLAQREKALTIERGRRRQRCLRRRRKNRISLNQERRAAKTLGIIMGCFIVCWLPFFIIELLKPFCPDCQFSPSLLKALTWLGYLNSALNPIIYTFFNQDFRKGFQRIICCSVKR